MAFVRLFYRAKIKSWAPDPQVSLAKRPSSGVASALRSEFYRWTTFSARMW